MWNINLNLGLASPFFTLNNSEGISPSLQLHMTVFGGEGRVKHRLNSYSAGTRLPKEQHLSKKVLNCLTVPTEEWQLTQLSFSLSYSSVKKKETFKKENLRASTFQVETNQLLSPLQILHFDKTKTQAVAFPRNFLHECYIHYHGLQPDIDFFVLSNCVFYQAAVELWNLGF